MAARRKPDGASAEGGQPEFDAAAFDASVAARVEGGLSLEQATAAEVAERTANGGPLPPVDDSAEAIRFDTAVRERMEAGLTRPQAEECQRTQDKADADAEALAARRKAKPKPETETADA